MTDDIDLIRLLSWLGIDLPKFFTKVQYNDLSTAEVHSFKERLKDLVEILEERISDPPPVVTAKSPQGGTKLGDAERWLDSGRTVRPELRRLNE